MGLHDDEAEERKTEEARIFSDLDQALLQKIRQENRQNDLRIELEQVNQTSFTLNGTGTLASCLAFACLRYGPRLYQQMKRPSSYVLDPPPLKLPLRVLAKVLAAGKLGVEVYAALWAGRWVTERDDYLKQECHAGSYIYNKSPEGGRQFLSKLSYFPPAVGQSIIATDLCPIVQDKLRNVRRVESYELEQFVLFAENCSRRQAVQIMMKRDSRQEGNYDDATSSTSLSDDNLSEQDLIDDQQEYDEWADDVSADQEKHAKQKDFSSRK